MISDEKFRKREHLLKSRDFLRVYKSGRTFRSEWLTVYSMRNGSGATRLGFSISSSIVKLAARRNRIRRVFREIFRKRKKTFIKGLDLVISVKKDPGSDTEYGKLENLFLNMAKQASLLI